MIFPISEIPDKVTHSILDGVSALQNMSHTAFWSTVLGFLVVARIAVILATPKRRELDIKGKKVVISGGSQGAGAALAELCYTKGANVVIVSRTVSKLEAQVQKIVTKHEPMFEGQTIRYIAADLTKEEEAIRVFSEETMPAAPDVIFSCAGAAETGFILDFKASQLASAFSTNYLSALFFVHAGTTRMAKEPISPKNPRYVAIFSSVLAFYPLLGYGQYCASKAAVRSLIDSLRVEALPFNIRVVGVFPGNFQSEGFEEENKTKPEITRQIEGPSQAISAEECAKIVFAQMEKGGQMITTDLIGWILQSIALSSSPRSFSLLQIPLAIFMCIFSPVWNAFVNRDVRKYFHANTAYVTRHQRGGVGSENPTPQ